MRFGVLIAAMQPVSISLPVFRGQRRAGAFWSKNRLFPLLPLIYAKCERQAWGKTISCFLPNHNLIAIKQLQTAQPAPRQK